jgi:hypothetical protein
MKIADIENSISILFLLRSKFLCELLSSSQPMYTSNILVKYLMGRFVEPLASPKMVLTTIHCCLTSFKACFWSFFSRSSISHIMYSCSLLKPKGLAPYHLSASLNFVHTFLNKARKELAHIARRC